MIGETVQFLDKFREESNRNIYDCRRFLARLVEKSLSDFDEVAVLSKKGEVNECKVALDLCQVFLGQCPGVFITPLPHQSPATPPLSDIRPGQTSEEEQLTQAFLLWYLSRILALLGHEQCSNIHQQTLEKIHKLLSALKNRDFYAYQSVLDEILLCIADLVRVNENLYENGAQSDRLTRFAVPTDKVLRSLQEPDQRTERCEIKLSSANFDINDVDVCDLLQLNLMRLLVPVIGDVSQLCSRQIVTSFWACLACHVEYGNIPLKTETLYACSALMKQKERLPLQVEEYFTDCILALLEFLCDGVVDVEKSELMMLETAMADVLVQLLASDGNFLPSQKLVAEKILLKLPPLIKNKGLDELHTVEIRSAIGRMICDVEDSLSLTYLKMTKCDSHWHELMALLVEEIGVSDNIQFAIGPLVKAIMHELSLVSMKGEKDHQGNTINEGTEREIKKETRSTVDLSKRKRKLDEGPPALPASSIRLGNSSETYKKLIVKLTHLLKENISLETLVIKADGVRMVIDILVTCVSLYNGSGAMTTKSRVIKEILHFGSWLSPEYIQEVMGFLCRVLQTVSSGTCSPELINQCLLSVLHTVGSLLAVHEFADFDSEMYVTAGWMCSFPWLLNDPSWQDLKPANSRDIIKIARAITEHLDTNSVCESLWVLSLLPKEVASKWRIHVFRQALCDSDERLKKGALEVFPVLLHHLGPNANHLVYDLIHPFVSQKSQELELTLSAITGPLACVVSRKAVINRPNKVSVVGPLYRSLTIGCMSCDSSNYADVSGSPRERPKLVDPNMFSPFQELIESKHVPVRLALIKSFRRMFGHIVVRKNNAATIQILKSALVLIQDTNYDVRTSFSEIIQDVIGETTQEGSSGPQELVYGQLKNTYTLAKEDNNYKLMETLLLSLSQLGRVCDGDLLVSVIIMLLENLLSPVAGIAYEQLHLLVEQKKTESKNLFMRCRLQICTFLAEAMHDAQLAQLERGDEMPHFGKTGEEILTDVAKVLGFENTKTFLTSSVKYIVPLLVLKGTSAASTLIKMVATHLSVPSRSKLLNDNTRFIFAYMVLYKKEGELPRVSDYLQRETTIPFDSLLRYHYQRVHNELLLHLSTHHSQVFRGLKSLAPYDDNFKGQIKTSEEMANYLQPRILGVLAFFDGQFLNASVPIEEKKLALQSLVSIIRLMGVKIISGIRHKVMNTLRIGLTFTDKEFVEISCRAWNCFVRSIDICFLGQMLPQIVATLLPLLQQLPKQTAEIFNYMIVDNRVALKSYFHDIYFLPEMPELSEANKVLEKFSSGSDTSTDILGQLSHAMKGIQHESLDVRLHALSKLKKLLQEQTVSYFQLVVGSETAESIVSELVAVLLKGCREPDAKAQRLYAECLGKCAAIDPGRLELSTNNPKAELAKFHTSIQDTNFAVALISEVVKSYLAATEPRIQDCSSYALQELLSIYEITDSPAAADSLGAKLWKRFPEHIQEILTPLLSSKYMLSTDIDWSNLQKPIYCSKKGNTFKDWVGTWTGYLCSKVKQEKAYRVFRSCSALISKCDIQTALYVLPYVVLHVLQDGSEQDIDEVYQEINEVLVSVQRSDTRHKTMSNFHHMSAQTVFSVLDYLEKWKRYTAQMKAAELPPTKGTASYLSDPGYQVVSNFLDKIPQDLLANVSYSCQAFTRALMHFEMFVKGHDDILQEQLDFMQKLYEATDEPDGVLGVAAIRQSAPTLQQQILTHGCLGQQHEMQACYEQAVQTEPDDVTHHQGLLRGLMDLGQHSKALIHCTGAIAERKSWGVQLNTYQIEAAWKLGNWDKLKTFIKADKGSRNWPVALGKVLLAAKGKKEQEFFQQLQLIRQDQMGPLSAASMEKGSYQRGYEYIVRLHMLNEIEETARVFLNFSSDADESRINREELLTQWQTRLNMMQSSFRIQEPVLTLRRILLTLAQQESEADLDREIGQCWLWSAKIARKAGYLQTAYSSLLQASGYSMPEFCLEKAKWLWEKGCNEQAISLLEREMQVHFSDVPKLKADTSEQAKAKRKVYAQALLLYGRYSEETCNMESNAIVKQYKEVIEVNTELEDGYFYLAKYFDKIMTTLIEDKDDISRQGEFVIHVVKNFGLSLQHGNQFIYQSMPRMLSLWLDFGAGVIEQEKKERSKTASIGSTSSQGLEKLRHTVMTLNRTIRGIGKTLAPYQLFFAFPQLISRLCHAHPDVFEQLKAIIARLVVSYPQQALWLLMAVSKSSYQMRVKRCQEIFSAAKEMKPSLQKVIQDYTKLTERLLELCEKDFPNTATLSVTTHFRFLKRLLEDSTFSSILVPLQSSMTVSLPTTTEGASDHNPFPGNLVCIRGFEDTIEVLPSLQRPKKITMKGSDGRLYMMLCKPKDDLRKDCRLMEFNGIVNKFLRKDPESRRRSLNIRTYTVIPLNEECGLLEWVNNTSGLRHILIKLYREKGIYTSGKELKQMMSQLQSPLETKLHIYKTKLLPRHPPVFSEWFLRTFPDPTSWYNARLSYARTIAVMSMVGYILGLGDRHGENILFDSTSGDCVHVDFNCLFNRGEAFEWAEKVPFRLTHNLVDAMGPLKLEGIFRRACEVTLRVIRNEIDPLMSVLKPFVYDPLVEWRKPTKRDTGEITNEQARVHVQNIEHRLRGILKNKTKPRGLALSVEGHVNYLIQEATDEKNLCQMYIGWAAYL